MLSAGSSQKGFEAYVVRADGTRYAEHQIVQHPSATSCFLQSEEGKKYTIHLKATAMVKRLNPKHDWIIDFRVDGRLVSRLAHRKGIIKVQCSEINTEEDGQILEGRLVFAKVPVTSDADKVTMDHTTRAGLGDIRIDVYDGKYAREVEWKKPVISKADIGVAKESDAKRLGCTGVTSQTPYQASESTKGVDFIFNDETQPFFSFVFQYRTRIALEVLGVIEREERSHSPTAVKVEKKRKRTGPIVIHDTDSEGDEVEEDRDGNEASDDEISAMERRLNKMEAMLRKANEQDKRDRQRRAEPEDLVDITGDDSEGE